MDTKTLEAGAGVTSRDGDPKWREAGAGMTSRVVPGDPPKGSLVFNSDPNLDPKWTTAQQGIMRSMHTGLIVARDGAYEAGRSPFNNAADAAAIFDLGQLALACEIAGAKLGQWLSWPAAAAPTV